jgi:Leucine-rich repeat (LRR) protein
LKDLEELNLVGCPLQEFPSQLHRLPSLRSLAIGDEKMRVSRKDVSQLAAAATKLRELNLFDIQDASVLDEIAQITNLEGLSLFDVNLPRIPDGWTKLHKLVAYNSEFASSL